MWPTTPWLDIPVWLLCSTVIIRHPNIAVFVRPAVITSIRRWHFSTIPPLRGFVPCFRGWWFTSHFCSLLPPFFWVPSRFLRTAWRRAVSATGSGLRFCLWRGFRFITRRRRKQRQRAVVCAAFKAASRAACWAANWAASSVAAAPPAPRIPASTASARGSSGPPPKMSTPPAAAQ